MGHSSGLGALRCGFPAFACPEERRGSEVGCDCPGVVRAPLQKGRRELPPWLHTQEAHQPLVLAVEVVEGPVAPRVRPCPSSSCSRPSFQCPQPPAGLPAPACQASAALAGLQALAHLPLQWRCPAQSLPQLQHGRAGLTGGACSRAKGGQGGWAQRASSLKLA